MKKDFVSISFYAAPGLVIASALVVLACGPGEPASDPSMPVNSPVPEHLDRPADPSGSPKSADAG